VSSDRLTVPQNEDRLAHVGVHEQKQADKYYIGVVLPVGRMTSAQAACIGSIADRYGSGQVRLTVWQNLIIPDIAKHDLRTVKDELRAAGLEYKASSVRAGLVACTGSAGCKYAAADTKQHALLIAEHLQAKWTLDQA